MKDHFSITITDVHGARNYSYSQFVKKFAKFVILSFFVLVVAGVTWIWWLNQETTKIEDQRVQAELRYKQVLAQEQENFTRLANERETLQTELDQKTQQLQMLDQTLQGLEELVGVTSDKPPEALEAVDVDVAERVKLLQQTTFEKQLMLSDIPNGRPVLKFKGVSSGYGMRTHPVRGTREFHHGIDYRGLKGDKVIATADAVVEYAGYHKSSGYGKLIILSHAYGFKTFYGHLSKMHVKTGSFVNKGDIIGDIGSTGISTGPHLHYEVNFVQKKLNPVSFVEWNLQNYNPIFSKVEGVPWGSLALKVQSRVQELEKQLSLRGVE